MESNLAQAHGLGQGDEVARDVLRPQWGAVLPGEDQVVRLVGVAPALPVEVLAEPDLQQCLAARSVSGTAASDERVLGVENCSRPPTSTMV
nr:hypothetical protein [Geodermatophilus nigrescens]